MPSPCGDLQLTPIGRTGHHGTSVPRVGSQLYRDSIVDVFTVLEGLESMACSAAAERATPEDVEGLGRLVEQMDCVVGAGKLRGLAGAE